MSPQRRAGVTGWRTRAAHARAAVSQKRAGEEPWGVSGRIHPSSRRRRECRRRDGPTNAAANPAALGHCERLLAKRRREDANRASRRVQTRFPKYQSSVTSAEHQNRWELGKFVPHSGCAATVRLSPRDVERLCATQCSRSHLAHNARQLLDAPGARVAGRHRAAEGRGPLAEPRRAVSRGRGALRERQQLRRWRERALRQSRVRGRLTRLGPLPRRSRGDRARRRCRASHHTRARLPAARVSIRVPG